jgi:hypothetical protein
MYSGGDQFKASLGKVSMSPYLESKVKAKGLGMWLKQTVLAWQTNAPYFNPRYRKKKKDSI